MHHVTVFSPRREAAAVAAMTEHNAELIGTLRRRTDALVTAAVGRHTAQAEAVRLELWQWCREELLEHVIAEEEALYPRARAEEAGTLLVDGMLEDHATVRRLVADLGEAPDPVLAVAAAAGLLVMLETHLKKESEQLLPLLARSPYVSLADVVAGIHELAGEDADQLADSA